MKRELKLKLLPLIMTAAVITVDQIVKQLVVMLLDVNRSVDVIGDFLRLTHRRNPYIIFGGGNDLPPVFQTVLFLVLPVLALGLLVFFYFREKDVRQEYRLPLCAIMGGGLGNLLDRVIRPDGVVDCIDIKLYGLLGMSRWPTFNVADMSIVIGTIIILVIALAYEIRKKKNKTIPPPTAP
jgi:signal peptidase II